MRGKRTFLAAEGGRVHSLAHHFDDECDGVLKVGIIFVVLLEETLSRAIVRPDACCFPA